MVATNVVLNHNNDRLFPNNGRIIESYSISYRFDLTSDLYSSMLLQFFHL